MEILPLNGSKRSRFEDSCCQRLDGQKCVWQICQRAFGAQFVAEYPIHRIVLSPWCGQRCHCNMKKNFNVTSKKTLYYNILFWRLEKIN